LANAVGITVDQLQNFETGCSRIDACLLLKITNFCAAKLPPEGVQNNSRVEEGSMEHSERAGDGR
jgi:hypothetical protein